MVVSLSGAPFVDSGGRRGGGGGGGGLLCNLEPALASICGSLVRILVKPLEILFSTFKHQGVDLT